MDARGLMVELECIKSMTSCSKSLQILIQVQEAKSDRRDLMREIHRRKAAGLWDEPKIEGRDGAGERRGGEGEAERVDGGKARGKERRNGKQAGRGGEGEETWLAGWGEDWGDDAGGGRGAKGRREEDQMWDR